MTGYLIRKVQFEDLDLCTEVIRKSFATVAKEFGLTIKNCPTNAAFIRKEHLVLDLDQSNLYGLYYDEELVGFMKLLDKGEGVFELGRLSVLPEHRHNGGGAMLIDFASKEVPRMGGKKITIGIIESNLILKNWYLKQGFIHTGTKKFSHLPFTTGFMEMPV